MKRAKYNKTYKQRATKKERRQTLTILSGIFALVMLLALYSCIISIYTKGQEISTLNTKQTISIKDLTIITLTSSNPTNEQIAYLAAFQAVDKYFSTNTKRQKLDKVYDVISMARTENRNFSLSTPGNDSYDSLGLFQISRHFNPSITTEQQLDPYFNADWTLRRMISSGYPNNRDLSIRRHNGSLNWRTADYLKKVNIYKQYLINLNNN